MPRALFFDGYRDYLEGEWALAGERGQQQVFCDGLETPTAWNAFVLDQADQVLAIQTSREAEALRDAGVDRNEIAGFQTAFFSAKC